MIPLSEIEWGPTDAAQYDNEFMDKFVEPTQISQLFDDELRIITGEKGSGKTALRQAIRYRHEAGQSKYSGIVDINLDSLESTTIVRNLTHVASVTQLPALTLITNYWKYCLIVEAMKEFFDREKGQQDWASGLVYNYLVKKGIIESSMLRMMLNLAASMWELVDRFTTPESKKEGSPGPLIPSTLASQVVEEVSRYPIFDPEFINAKKEFARALKAHQQQILIVLDGFDRLQTEYKMRDAIRLIFDGLASAVLELAKDNDFDSDPLPQYRGKRPPRLIEIKALVPHDRYLGLNLRERDKISDITNSIRWDYYSLQEFLSKRMRLHPKLQKYTNFDNLWSEVMPETITNPYYRVEEKSYDYILRHTMYRPRHLQLHLRNIARMYPAQNIDPSMIPKSINRSSRDMMANFIQEYKLDHPNLEGFMRRLKDKTNIMTFQDFHEYVDESLKHYQANDVTTDEKIDLLYTMGFFGVVRYLDTERRRMPGQPDYIPPRKSGQLHCVDFFYKDPILQVSSTLKDTSYIAFHPALVDYADMQPHPDLIVG